MKNIRRLARDESGAAMVQAALALPPFLMMIWGITQFGLAVHANNGIQNALGEGARFATLCVSPSLANGCRRPSNDQIIAKINSSRFASAYGSFGTPTVTESPSSETIKYLDLRVTYSAPTNLIFVNGPVITFIRTKRVYVAGDPVA